MLHVYHANIVVYNATFAQKTLIAMFTTKHNVRHSTTPYQCTLVPPLLKTLSTSQLVTYHIGTYLQIFSLMRFPMKGALEDLIQPFHLFHLKTTKTSIFSHKFWNVEHKAMNVQCHIFVKCDLPVIEKGNKKKWPLYAVLKIYHDTHQWLCL